MRERFEITIDEQRKRDLDALAAEVGISSRDLARLAIVRLLADPAPLTGRPTAEATAR